MILPSPTAEDGNVAFNYVRTLYLLKQRKSKGVITDTEYRKAKACYENAMTNYLHKNGLV